MAEDVLTVATRPSIAEIRTKYKLTQDETNQALVIAVSDAAILGERVAKEGAPRDTAALARSIDSVHNGMEARVFSTLNYAAPVELGRQAGAAMPPPEALVGWLRRHGNFTTPYALARSIARRGIKGRFFMRAARKRVEDERHKLLDAAAVKIARMWGKL